MIHQLKTSHYKQIAEMQATSGVRPIEGHFLAWLASKWGKDTIVEIGSCEGRSAAYMADALHDAYFMHGQIHCVDLWDLGKGVTPSKHSSKSAEQRFYKNLNNLGLMPYITPHKGYSSQVARSWSAPISLLFIDGDHTFQGCLSDFLAWNRYVRVGGVIAFHDTDQPDINKVVTLFLKKEEWKPFPIYDRIMAFQKRDA